MHTTTKAHPQNLSFLYTISLPRHWVVQENHQRKYGQSDTSFFASIFKLGRSGEFFTKNPGSRLDFDTAVMNFTTELVIYLDDILLPGWQTSSHRADDLHSVLHHVQTLLTDDYAGRITVLDLRGYLDHLTHLISEKR